MPRARSTTCIQFITALVCTVALTACSADSTPEPADDASGRLSKAPRTSAAGFCQQYADAGGSLATPGPFQLALPPQRTVSDLFQRVRVLDAATPPEEIATQWKVLRELYAEAIDIAEATPDNGVLDGPQRIFEIVKEIDAPSTQITAYLQANCSDRAEGPATKASTPAPTPEADAAHLPQDELSDLFKQIQFRPGQYDKTDDLVGSVYPGLIASDTSCLAPFGLHWAEDAADAGVASEFGMSNDGSMTAVVVSAADADVATAMYGRAQDALERCSDGSALFELSGAPVEMQIERTEPTITGADEALGWRAVGEVGGSPFALIGITAQVGGTAIALVGWDPATNESDVPQATQMFLDAF